MKKILRQSYFSYMKIVSFQHQQLNTHTHIHLVLSPEKETTFLLVTMQSNNASGLLFDRPSVNIVTQS